MIDHDVLPATRNLACHALHALDRAGKLRVQSAVAEIVGNETTASRGALSTGRLVGLDGDADDQDVAAGRADGAVSTVTMAPASLVAMSPFAVKYGQRRRDCVVLIDSDDSVLVLFALWDLFAALCEHLGADRAAAAIMRLPAHKLLGLARAFVRGSLDRGDWTLLLTGADGSGRAWAEIDTCLPPSPWRVAVATEAATAPTEAAHA